MPSDNTTGLTTDSATLAGELFADGVGAQAGPPSTPLVVPPSPGASLSAAFSRSRAADMDEEVIRPRPPSAAR